MNRPRAGRILVSAVALLIPTLALAEVSVQMDARGNFKRTWFLTFGKKLIWKQIRPNLAPHLILNPLGDSYGDGAPAIQAAPLTGYPLVAWPKNFGNLHQIAFSEFGGTRWSAPVLIQPGLPLVYDDIEPALSIDSAGVPYVVWTRMEQTSKIYLSMRLQGRWTPPLLLSDAAVPSRRPGIVMNGTTAVVTYATAAGIVTRNYETAFLVDSAASLMDNPIPPLNAPPTGPPGGNEPPPNDFVHNR